MAEDERVKLRVWTCSGLGSRRRGLDSQCERGR